MTDQCTYQAAHFYQNEAKLTPIFWNVTLCTPLKVNPCFGWMCHLQVIRAESQHEAGRMQCTWHAGMWDCSDLGSQPISSHCPCQRARVSELKTGEERLGLPHGGAWERCSCVLERIIPILARRTVETHRNPLYDWLPAVIQTLLVDFHYLLLLLSWH